MERIKGLEKNEAPWLMRPLFFAYRKIVGYVGRPLKIQAHRPSISWFGNLLGVAIERSGKIEQKIHTLAQLRAAQIVECPF